MKSIKTHGIIIKRMELGEADRLLTIFTYELGKVRALAKGSRKPLSRLAGHLEPFSLTDCQLHEGKSFYLVTGASIETAFAGIRADLTKTSLACYFLEMVDSLTVDLQAQLTVFELLRESLVVLESVSRKEDYTLLRAAFSLKLLTDLGYLPELTRCVNCHQLLYPEGNGFSARAGGLLCPQCRLTDYDTLAISGNTIKAMRLLLAEPMSVISRVRISHSVLQELEAIIEAYLYYHVGRELYSSHFIKDAGSLASIADMR